MERTTQTKTKIILLLFIPIFNQFVFPAPDEKWQFFDLTAARKKWFSERENLTFSKEKWLELFATDYNSQIEEIISQKKNAKMVVINYPQNEKQFDSFQSILTKHDLKIDQVILLVVLKYELILSLKNKYLICPVCEKITEREGSIQNPNNQEKEKVFVCPNDKEYRFPLNEIEQFNELIIEYYLGSTKKVVEKLLEHKKIVPTQLKIEQVEDIFSGKIQDQILKIIESL